MPYGTIKVDTITFTDAGVDKSVAISGLVQNPTFTGNVTATGTISGLIVQAPTVTGTTANFASGVYTTQISGAIVKVPAGSAGAPSIQVGVGASVAPGLYGAGTDLLGISTGGAGRIFIDSTGQLGIGTSSPSQALEVAGNISFTANAASARIFGPPLSSDTTLVLRGGSSTGEGANIELGRDEVVYIDATQHLFRSLAGTERLRIDSSGRVGIGNSSPSQVLDVLGNIRSVSGGSNEVILVGAEGAIELLRSDSGSYIDFKTTNLEDFDCRIQQSSNGLVFSTGGNGATSERLRIDGVGNVGIGNSSPNYVLDLNSGGATPAQIGTAVNWNFPGFILRRNASNVSTAKMLSMMLQGDTDSDTALTNHLNIWGTYSATPTTGSTTVGLSGVMNLGAPSGIALHVNESQRAFIDSGGDVFIGQFTNPATSRVVIQVRTGTANGVNAQITSDTGTSYPWSNYNTSGTYIGGISCTSTATSFPTSSDYRLKQNIQPLVNAAALLVQIKPSVFEFKQDPGTQVQGFIAHELQEVVPLAVIGEKDAKDVNGNPMYQGVDAAKLVPLLTAALQEAIVKIEALEVKVAALGSV